MSRREHLRERVRRIIEGDMKPSGRWHSLEELAESACLMTRETAGFLRSLRDEYGLEHRVIQQYRKHGYRQTIAQWRVGKCQR